jgi:glutathione S-transferase
VIKVYSWPTPNGHKVHIMLEECGQRLGRDWQVVPRSTLAPATSSSPTFCASAPTTRSRRWSTPTGPTANPSRCSSRAPFCCTWRPSSANCCPKATGRNSKSCSGSCSRWAAWAHAGAGAPLPHLRARKNRLRLDRYTNEAKRLYGVMNERSSTAPFWAGAATALPMWRCTPGCAAGRTRASTGPTTRTPRPGSTASGPARRAARRAGAGRCPQTPDRRQGACGPVRCPAVPEKIMVAGGRESCPERLQSAACRSVAQPGSASALGAEGREFESRRSDQPPSQLFVHHRLQVPVAQLDRAAAF